MEGAWKMDTPLNLAHRQQRKADSLLKSGKFDESISCHRKAADLLKAALLQTSSPKAKESLELQFEYHNRQEVVVKYRQHVYEALIKAKTAAANQTNIGATTTVTAGIESPRNIKVGIETAILRTMAENDSLLQFLIKDSNNVVESGQNGTKMPKDDKVIIEELRINGMALRKSIEQLLMKLDQETMRSKHLQDENDHLHRVIEDLQRTNASNRMKHLPVHVTIDPSSPYVFSPVTELTPSGGARELPALDQETIRCKHLLDENEHLHSIIEDLHRTNASSRNKHLSVPATNDSSSPSEFSPASELTPPGGGMRELPALPPLDLPSFDFSVWKSENTTHKM